jgi:MSHA biogenesis protein MshJ
MSAWQQMSERFSALKEREKYTAFIGALLLALWLFILQLLVPAFEEFSKAEQQITSATMTMQQQSNTLTALQQQAGVDIDANYKVELESLQHQEQELQQQISKLTSYFIGSERMASVLQDVLKSSNNVKMKSVIANPPVPLTFSEQGTDNKAVIYQHSTVVVLTGNYFALAAVLERLDTLSWSLGWQSIDYKVTEYPDAELTLHLLTVSDNESYIKL